MSTLPRRIARFFPIARSVAVAALMTGSFLALPTHSVLAADAPAPQAQADAALAQAETVEQRITTLHGQLMITDTEEAKWNNVAQAMRENAAAMEKLAVAKTLVAPQNMTAIDDLKGYEKFAQAHVDGLKNLTSSFEALYVSFPDAQKKLADQVFQTAGQKGAASHI